MLKRFAVIVALAALWLTSPGCLVRGPCDQLCFIDPEVLFFLTDERLAKFDGCDICVDGGCGGGNLECFRDGTESCACSETEPLFAVDLSDVDLDDPEGQSRTNLTPYNQPTNVFFFARTPEAGQTSAWGLEFEIAIGSLQTRVGTVTFPDEFDFNGFLALGPPGTQVGAYAFDINKDSFPDFTMPLLSVDNDHAFADLDRNGTQDAIDPTITHSTGSHIFTLLLPLGGDGVASRQFGPVPMRLLVALYRGLLVNPDMAGDYPVIGVFTSVDPESGDTDNATGNPPEDLAGGEANQTAFIDDSELGELDHFLCYKAKPSKGNICRLGSIANAGAACETENDCDGDDSTDFCVKNKLAKGIVVDVNDALEQKPFELKKPGAFCVPAEKNGEGDPQHAEHLRGYAIKEFGKSCFLGSEHGHQCDDASDCPDGGTCVKTPKHFKQEIRVENQLGVLLVQTSKPEGLLVPSSKGLASPPAPPTSAVEHFKCYKVKETKKRCSEDSRLKCKSDADCGLFGPCVQKFPKGIQVTLEDQFTAPKVFDVKKPKRLCMVADKNEEGVSLFDAHLMCYQIKRASGAPKHQKRTGVHITNQIARERLDTQDELEVCIPSLVSGFVQ